MPSYPDAVARFVGAAERYCDLIQTPSTVRDRAAFVLGIRAGLAELLASGFALPETEPWEDVTWEWKFGLQTHWGKHAEDALVALNDA